MTLSFFGKKHSAEKSSHIAPEIVASAHVMADDVHRGATASEIKKNDNAPQAKIRENPFLPAATKSEGARPASHPAPPAPPQQNNAVKREVPPDYFMNPVAALSAKERGKLDMEEKKPRVKVFLWLIIVLILAMLAGGAYYYWQGEVALSTMPAVISKNDVVVSPSIKKEAPLSPYAPDKPNFLSFNTETVTAGMIRQELEKAGKLIVEANMNAPVEFLVTDQNNNPLAFSRFALLAEISLPDDVLSQLEESFALFLLNDGGVPRAAFAFSLKDGEAAKEAIARNESVLPFAFRGLMLESDVSVPKSMTLRSGSFRNVVVRYVNIDESKNLSFDYIFWKNSWYISTSKNSLRAILNLRP